MSELFDKNGDLIEEVFDDEGNLIDDVLTVDEAEKRVEEAKEELKTSIDDDVKEFQEKLEEREKELREAQEALEKEQSKDKNFSKLRGKTDEKEKEIVTLRETIEELGKKIDKVGASGQEKNVQLAIDKMVGADEELGKKVKFFYDQFAGEPENDDKLKERIGNALVLATGGKEKDVLGSDAIAFGGGTVSSKAKTGEKLSSDAQELASKLDIDNNDLKRHKLL